MKSAIRNPKSAIRNAFSLVELIIVIAIIIILGGIGIGVGYKFLKAADIETTKANMTLIMNAIEKYYDENGSYPGDQPTPLTPGHFAYTDFLYKDLFGVEWLPTDNDPNPDLCTYTNSSIGKTALSKLDADCMVVQQVPYFDYNKKNRRIWGFIDSFDNFMLYSPRGALGSRPLLISAGEDGKFGPGIFYYFDDGGYDWNEDSTDTSTADDNIRSDK